MQTCLEDLRKVSKAHPHDISALAYSDELSIVMTGDRDGLVRCWDFQDLKLVADLNLHTSPITAIACANQYPVFITADAEGSLCVWTSRGHASPYQLLYRFANKHRIPELYDPDGSCTRVPVWSRGCRPQRTAVCTCAVRAFAHNCRTHKHFPRYERGQACRFT
ncbi:hypothetical protein EON62_00360 [archaeon]|nr:MAG: hypothetical protein EON62_00360 [archaeon]